MILGKTNGMEPLQAQVPTIPYFDFKLAKAKPQ